MKVIDIPESVTISFLRRAENGIVETEQQVPFLQFLQESLDQYADFSKGAKQARQYDQLCRVIEAVNGEKVVRFGPADFEVVRSAVEAARWISPKVNRAYLPYYEALEKAQDVKPPTETKQKHESSDKES